MLVGIECFEKNKAKKSDIEGQQVEWVKGWTP